MAETLSMISIISFVAAAICLAVTMVFFIRFKIPSVIGDLSGRSARKSMEQMREIKEKSDNKAYRPGKINLEWGKLTETMHGERQRSGETEKIDWKRSETGLPDENQAGTVISMETEMSDEESKTEVLLDENATVVLDDWQKRVYLDVKPIPIEILEEVMLVHTREEIP